MDIINDMMERARRNRQRIVLPEGTEERTLQAADRALADGIADSVLLGGRQEIEDLAARHGLQNLGRATVVDPEANPQAEEYARLLAELRQKKGMTL